MNSSRRGRRGSTPVMWWNRIWTSETRTHSSKAPLKQNSPFQKQCKPPKLPLENASLPKVWFVQFSPPCWQCIHQGSTCVMQRECKACHEKLTLQSFSHIPKALKYATSELKLEKQVISKHSKPSWRYYDMIKRQKHTSECLAYLTDWYHHMSKQLAEGSLRQRSTSSQELI